MIKFAPSLLAADFSNLQEELQKVDSASYLHLDIMDGLFVPNITFGPGLINSLRPHSSLKFDTHLMINRPERYIKQFAEAGSDLITFHVEASLHVDRTVHQVKEMGCGVGLALNPATSLDRLEYILPELDQVLIMSVNPGFGGQSFIPEILRKIEDLDRMIVSRGLDVEIEVDGGIKMENIREVVSSGADIIVAGSAIFKSDNPALALEDMKNSVSSFTREN